MNSREWLNTVEADVLSRPTWLTDPLIDTAKSMIAALRAVLDLAECDVRDEYDIFIYPATIRAAIDAHLGDTK